MWHEDGQESVRDEEPVQSMWYEAQSVQHEDDSKSMWDEKSLREESLIIAITEKKCISTSSLMMVAD